MAFDGKSGDFPAAQTAGQIYQGNAASFSITPSAGLTTTADPAYHDLALTVAVEVLAAWKACTGKTQKAPAEGGEVRFDAVPGTDEIIIKPE